MSESESMPVRVGDALVWQSELPNVIFAQRIPTDDPIVVEYDLSTDQTDASVCLRCHYSELSAARDGITGLLKMPDAHSANLDSIVYGQRKAAPAADCASEPHSVGDIDHRAILANALERLQVRAGKIGAVWSKRLAIHGYDVTELLCAYTMRVLSSIDAYGWSDSEAVQAVDGLSDDDISAGLSRAACQLRGHGEQPPERGRLHSQLSAKPQAVDRDSEAVVDAILPNLRRDCWTVSREYPLSVTRQRALQVRKADQARIDRAVISAIVDVYA